jgi:tetratricopeptide (TPR) repeat protein
MNVINSSIKFSNYDIKILLDEFKKSIEHIIKASKIKPNDPKVLSILSSIYRGAGWFDTSIKSCLKALEYDPNNIVAYIQLAVKIY